MKVTASLTPTLRQSHSSYVPASFSNVLAKFRSQSQECVRQRLGNDYMTKAFPHVWPQRTVLAASANVVHPLNNLSVYFTELKASKWFCPWQRGESFCCHSCSYIISQLYHLIRFILLTTWYYRGHEGPARKDPSNMCRCDPTIYCEVNDRNMLYLVLSSIHGNRRFAMLILAEISLTLSTKQIVTVCCVA